MVSATIVLAQWAVVLNQTAKLLRMLVLAVVVWKQKAMFLRMWTLVVLTSRSHIQAMAMYCFNGDFDIFCARFDSDDETKDNEKESRIG